MYCFRECWPLGVFSIPSETALCHPRNKNEETKQTKHKQTKHNITIHKHNISITKHKHN